MSTQTPPPTTTATPSVDVLARQLRSLKWVILLLSVALAGGIAYYAYDRHAGQPVAILVNGKPIATVRNMADADQILVDAETMSLGPAYAAQNPIRLQTVQLQGAPADASVDTDADARARLMKTLTLRVHAWVIMADGKPSIGLPTENAAEQTLELIKQHFARMPPAGTMVGEPEFVQNVTIALKTISLARARANPQAAAPYFWTPPPAKEYTVRHGDTGYMIALHNHVSFSDFLAANAGRDVNHLRPGDQVNVERIPLLLSVQVRKTFTSDQPVLPDRPASSAGLERVTYVVTYLNGQEMGRDVSNAAILRKPTTQSDL